MTIHTARENAIAAYDFALYELELADHGIPCVAVWCIEKMHRAEHAADWWAVAPCGRRVPVCQSRRLHALQQGSATCSGCNYKHPYNRIVWDRIQHG